ncbi:MAG: leucyl aminopeptidase [Propionibacteriaceae bacterium]|jgi:leucyl aminopeptidase|nr:leucyl aminopeptidase [Propionibacteriaceae bacterium]
METALPRINLATAASGDADVIVVGIAAASGGDILVGLPPDMGKKWAAAFGKPVLDVAQSVGAESETGTVAIVPGPGGQRMLVAGLGKVDVTTEAVRRGVGAAFRAALKLPSDKGLRISVSLDALQPELVKGAVEGALLGAYQYRPKGKGIAAIEIVSPSKDAKPAATAGVTTATAVIRTRDWVNKPANEIYPESFAELARGLAKEAKLDFQVWDEKALADEGCGGILAVGSGSARPPRLIRAGYTPRGAKAHLALVGKGITFDSGGLDLKPPDSMYTMRTDMTGAASVLAATAAIARLGLKVKVTAWAAMAENMPSGTATHPSDVLTMRNGKTVENGNTDAEGRLVLADALSKAAAEKPDLIVDVATLTGSCVVALGERVAGLMARDDATADRVLDAAETAGELFWHLPIPEETGEKLKSNVADLRSTADRPGGALTAARFLSEFVPEPIAWAHLDVAGTAFNPHAAYYYVPEGATGMSVRTLIALAAGLAG